ncbi:MAG: DUF4442 domain-containing protein [Bacteroidia bacterium]|nr:DUF4442 domain-containing protein [Bacteroidia bacterium]
MSSTKFKKLVNNSFLFRTFLLSKLPMAFIAGVRTRSLTDETAVVTIKYRWLTQNPFRSMYFACQSMAAEMSTGLLVMNHTYESQPAISMLIVKNSAVYSKKATGKITFTCDSGNHIASIIAQTKQTGEGITTDLRSVGTDEAGDIVAEFIFTWSLKAKSK